MNYLLDTTAIAELVKPRPDRGLLGWLAEIDENRTHLSVVTLGELRRGIDRLPNGKRRARLERWLGEELPARFERRLLPADANVALEWGACRASADHAGRLIDPIDALIAATAITHRLTVVTRNVRHFQAVDVPIICPWEDG